MSLNAVEASAIELGYGPKTVVTSSDFTVPFGKLTAVIGPNGSGKSTLLNALAGLLEPKAGKLKVITEQRRIAYVMQSTKVSDSLPISVAEVVAMGRYPSKGLYRRLDQSDRDAIEAAMHRLGIADLARSHLSTLSGGQRQRAFVAQGLAQDHDMLLLDEPLTGIDITTAQAIDEVIHQEVDEGCAVIMTTHDLSEAAAADHVLLVSGSVLASGPPETVLTREFLSQAYGSSLLHVTQTPIWLDDAAHLPTDTHHTHRDRVIHVEPDHNHPGD